ncbi:DUF82 family protein [Natrialba magadii ATCC 43099]|uniref:DUF82 family protein n=2 Tax=Natrialba magadii (strain ATCC 43099 / DSM 3394 / CCM 3739 / CIP 104546 / IAM 13178 / JCM 8861 / NBRC 102185 / NCIMB 2190 / MS3) TaxID=547559 RepID=D3SRL4_NATMM|nr:Mut7-C RNAse domain-containing protein [Natrialba magadii]ADD04719.1 DUF82 family protein [Natrialba magadii ATCC 43099]
MQFLLDTMCGGLVAYLRMCDYDTVYAGDREPVLESDDDLLAVAAAEDRTLVTRDTELAGRADDAILLTALEVEEQLGELSEAGVELELAAEPSYCGRCNGVLERVDPSAETPEYAPDPVADPGDDDGGDDEDSDTMAVWRCRSCGQYFWRGSHWDRVARTLSEY